MEEAFSKDINAILAKKISTMDGADEKFTAGWGPIEKAVFAAIKRHISTLSQSGKIVDFSTDNLTQVNELNRVISKALRASGYHAKVADYLRDFETVKKYNIQVNASANAIPMKDLEKLLNPVQKEMVDQTLDGLLGSGIDKGFKDPMRNGIVKNIIGGTTVTQLTDWVEAYCVSNEERMGTLKRYAGQVAQDALSQFDGAVNDRILTEYKLNAIRYVGSIIDDSRPQCIRWVGMEILLLDDLDKEITWAYNNGSGMIPGTNRANFCTARGGFRCRHTALPFKMTKSQKEEFEALRKAQKAAEEKPAPPPPVETPPDPVKKPKTPRKPKTPPPPVIPDRPTWTNEVERVKEQNFDFDFTKLSDPLARKKVLMGFVEENIPDLSPAKRKELEGLSLTDLQDQIYTKMGLGKLYTNQGQMARFKGYEKKPVVLDKKDFNEILSTGEFLEVRRGLQDATFYRDPKTNVATVVPAAKLIDDFKHGTLFHGRGIFGNGTYFDYGSTDLDMPGVEFAASVAYAAEKKENIFRALIPKNASLLKWTDMDETWNIYFVMKNAAMAGDPFPGGLKERFLKMGYPAEIFTNLEKIAREKMQMSDEGDLATIIGFDGIIVDRKTPDGRATMKYINYFNRPKMIIER